MRLRGLLLVVLGLLVLGGFVHAPLHAAEGLTHEEHEDCAADLFCTGAVDAFAASAPALFLAPLTQTAPASAEAAALPTHTDGSHAARGPPRS